MRLVQKQSSAAMLLKKFLRQASFIKSTKTNCSCNYSRYFQGVKKIKEMDIPVVYRSVNSVLEVLQKEENQSFVPVKELLKIYHSLRKQHAENLNNHGVKHPLVILEGLDGSGKTTVARKLTMEINGIRWCTPPNDIRHIRDDFDEHPTLRTAYYALGNYIAALQISTLLKRKTVVMDRYWHSTAAYAAAQAVADNPDKNTLPPPGDEFYSWPDDLLKPDHVYFLQTSENVRLQRHSRRRDTAVTKQEKLLKNCDSFRQDVIKAYENMFNPGIEIVNSDGTVEECVADIKRRISSSAK